MLIPFLPLLLFLFELFSIQKVQGVPGPTRQRLQRGAPSHSPASLFPLLTFRLRDSPGLFQTVPCSARCDKALR
ncbi:hypothetical protein LEMLEM_LOCUS26544 [Lemmus lemmus]